MPRQTIAPRIIIYTVVLKYLNEETANQLKKELNDIFTKNDSLFIKTIQKYFDFNVLKDNPKYWQDIWIYNYLMYEVKSKISTLERNDKIEIKGKLPRKGLVLKYATFLNELKIK